MAEYIVSVQDGPKKVLCTTVEASFAYEAANKIVHLHYPKYRSVSPGRKEGPGEWRFETYLRSDKNLLQKGLVVWTKERA